MFKDVIKEQLKVPAHIDYLADLRDFVTRIGKRHGFSDKIINAFKLAIDEAGTNIIRHAYRDRGGDGFITIRALVKKNSLTICLIDQGKFFDPQRVKDPDLQRYVDIGKKGGLGIFIMRKLMDEIDYRRTEEGNELRLTKTREQERSKSKLHVPVAKAVKGIPATLKAKYWIRTSAVITAVVGLGYLYFFLRVDFLIRQEVLARLTETANLIKNNLLADDETLLDYSGSKIAGSINVAYGERKDFLYDVIVVDTTNFITAHTDINRAYKSFDEMPAKREIVARDISLYRTKVIGQRGKVSDKQIYDHFTPIVNSRINLNYGFLHVRVLMEYADHRIGKRRAADGTLALTILLLSYAGTMVLIYIVMNPFRKLADWVGTLGHGGEVSDDMDIDNSTAVGEIAQAFSDITVKFRESQKNLAEQERLQKEMQVAQEIQQALLPSDFPDLEGYELASHYEAAKEVGGDYYDFVEVDKDTLGIVVADVSGKGVPGSLVMTMIRTALRTEARGLRDAAEVLSRVNDFVMGDMKKGMFVTIFYVIIDSKRRRVNYASAGHNPMILYRASSNRTYYLNPRGFPIGIQLHEKDLFRKSIESDTIQLAEDDILVLYTDGITEAMNSRRELFGEERLMQCIRECGGMRVVPFVEKLKEEIHSFTEGDVQYDDITVVAIREETSPEKEELRRAREAHRLIAEGKSIREACEAVGITTYAYYNKYKREFEEKGLDNYSIDAEVSVEAKHIAIEDKTKIFDIIKNHPEYGAKRISEELNTEKYGFTVISESKVYDELVRSRLNTRQLREAFVARGGRHRRPMKPPGTPMLTLDGKIIIDHDRRLEEKPETAAEVEEIPPPRPREGLRRPAAPKPPAPVPPLRKPTAPPRRSRVDLSDIEIDAKALFTPLEELLDRGRGDAAGTEPTVEEAQEQMDATETASAVPVQNLQTGETSDEAGVIADASEVAGVSFEELFAGGSIHETQPESPEEAATSGESPADTSAATVANIAQVEAPQAHAPPPEVEEKSAEKLEEEVTFSAADELLRLEIENTFAIGESQAFVDDLEVSQEPADTPSGPPPEEADRMLADDFSEALRTADHEISAGYADDDHEWADEAVPRLDQAGRRDEQSMAETPGLQSSAELEGAAAMEAFPPDTSASGKQPPDGNGHDEAGQVAGDDRERLLVNGLRYYKNQRFQDAIEEFKKAIALYPDFKEAHSILGNAYFRNHMYAEAANAYHRVKEMDCNDTTAYENMGVIYANRGEFADAVREWEQLLEIDPKRDDIRKKIDKATRLMQKASSA